MFGKVFCIILKYLNNQYPDKEEGYYATKIKLEMG